jgi:hypothetical protein
MTADVRAYTDSSRGGPSIAVNIKQSIYYIGSRLPREETVLRAKIRY